jgi:hypothetical protein
MRTFTAYIEFDAGTNLYGVQFLASPVRIHKEPPWMSCSRIYAKYLNFVLKNLAKH